MEDQLRTSTWLVEMMVALLKQYFGSPDRITFEKSDFTWNPSQPEAQLYISNIDNLDYKNMGQRPQLLVDLETQAFPEEVTGDLLSFQSIKGMNDYLVRSISSWSIECWGLKKLEAMSLADEVRYFLTTYRHPIAKKYCFDKIRVTNQLKPVKYKDFDNYWIARVIVGFELQEQWSLAQESLKMTGFSMKLNSEN